MQYIEEHAAEFGIQPEQYAIVGYSMGGHLTGLFGTESVGYKHYNVPKPAALLLGYPINDMTYIKPIIPCHSGYRRIRAQILYPESFG